MINTCVLHDDYENFAHYLGVDYDDYINLQLGLQDEDEFQPESVILGGLV